MRGGRKTGDRPYLYIGIGLKSPCLDYICSPHPRLEPTIITTYSNSQTQCLPLCVRKLFDIHPRQRQTGTRRSLLEPRLRAIPTRPARYTPRPASRLPQSCHHLQGLANVTSATPQRFELLLQFHRKNTRRLIQTAIDIHPRESQSGAMRSLQRARLRVAFFTGVDACH